jgi:hypothetical protein
VKEKVLNALDQLRAKEVHNNELTNQLAVKALLALAVRKRNWEKERMRKSSSFFPKGNTGRKERARLPETDHWGTDCRQSRTHHLCRR